MWRVFVSSESHDLDRLWFSWEKSFQFLGTFHLRAQFLLRKVCFCMSLSMLGGDESRRKALINTCVGQCVLKNTDFRNVLRIRGFKICRNVLLQC